MATRVLTQFDFQWIELLKVRLQNLSSPPSSPQAGWVYWDTTEDAIGVYDGSGWVYLGASGTTNLAYTASPTNGVVTSDTGTDATVPLADGTNAGLMAPAQHTKLAGIETGATADQTAAEILAALLTVDGTGSGLDADLLDGQSAAYYAVDADVVHDTGAETIAGVKTFSSSPIVPTPSGATDAANKAYVDALGQGLSAKNSVRVATTAAGTLASSFENGDTVDGVTLATGDRILIKDQAAGAENGIYVVAASGAPARATDFDTAAEIQAGAYVFVEEGTTNADSGWVLTTDGAITVGTTALAFTQFSGAGQITAGSALTKTGNTLDVAVDNSTIEVSGDALRVKDAGITPAKLSFSAAKKYSTTLTGGATSEVVTHNLNTRDVQVIVRNNASPWDEVIVDNEATTVNTVTLRSAENLPAGYTVTVIG